MRYNAEIIIGYLLMMIGIYAILQFVANAA